MSVEYDIQFAVGTVTTSNNVIVDWTVTRYGGDDDGLLPGVREPRKPAPAAPGMPACAEPSYTGG